MSHWPEIMARREAFAPIGERHGLQLRAGGVYAPLLGGGAVQVEVVDEDLVLLLLHAVGLGVAAAWLAALCDVLDVPAGFLPPRAAWVATADLVVAHDRELEALPTAGA